MRKHRLTGSLLLVAMLWALAPATVRAEESRNFLICHTGSVATAEEAQPYVDGFGGYLAGKLGWTDGSYQVQFENKRSAGKAAVDSFKPAYVTLSLGLYLELETPKKLKPLVLARVNGKTTNHYRILVKKGTASNLDDLKGKTLVGNLLDDPRFLSKVIFRGKLDVTTHFQLKQTKRPLRAIRKVARGKADAALVDDMQFASLKELPLFAELEVIYTSDPFPNLGMAYVEGRATAADVKTFADSLVRMCKDPDGSKMCETFAVEGFEPIPDGTFEKVRNLYR